MVRPFFFFLPGRAERENETLGKKKKENSLSLSSLFLDFFEQQARIITAAGGRAIAGPGVDVLDLMPTSYHGK